jgi:hypothetical protein
LIETNGLLFGSIGISTMIAVDVLENDFATAQKLEKGGNRALINKRANNAAVDKWVRDAFFELFRGFEFFSFRRRVSSHPPATNASRWAS